MESDLEEGAGAQGPSDPGEEGGQKGERHVAMVRIASELLAGVMVLTIFAGIFAVNCTEHYLGSKA